MASGSFVPDNMRILVLLYIVGLVAGAQVQQSSIVGDVKSLLQQKSNPVIRVKRKAVSDERDLWPNATIVYTFDDAIENHPLIKKAIHKSLNHWTERTCIKFIYRDRVELQKSDYAKNNKYVQFIKGTGCHSSVGRGRGVGAQNISIGRTCAFSEMVIHELGHLVGMWHEHARWDRDSNVMVLWKNVRENSQHNFKRNDNMKLLTPYDLSSMMHYSLKTFSANGEKTVMPVDDSLSFLVRYRGGLSFYDVLTVNKLYKCAAHCSPKLRPCQNDAFLNENCTCVCPIGLRGKQCQKVKTDKECGGVIRVKESVEITSPGYPKKYNNKANCQWLIKSPKDTKMELEFDDMDIEKSPVGFCRDKLEVRYHHIGVEKGPVFCGSDVNTSIASASNKMILKFTSNKRMPRRGFKVIIRTVKAQKCIDEPCQNAIKCEDIASIGTYHCHCSPGWLGKHCNIPILDGGLSEWSEWSHCTAKCGRQHRRRSCTNPIPKNGGRDCTGATFEARLCGSETLCAGYFTCDFGAAPTPQTCGFKQDTKDKLDWYMHHGETQSMNTGPPSGHTTGDDKDMYYYIEASYGRKYDQAIIWIPQTKLSVGVYCLQFFYNMHGDSMGSLNVIRRYSPGEPIVIWQRSGNHGNQWWEAHITFFLVGNVQLGFRGIRGAAFDSDMAIDDVSLSPGSCKMAKSSQVYGCKVGEQRYRQGEFYYTKGCLRHNCFCNSDGQVDCPEWKNENVCEEFYTPH